MHVLAQITAPRRCGLTKPAPLTPIEAGALELTEPPTTSRIRGWKLLTHLPRQEAGGKDNAAFSGSPRSSVAARGLGRRGEPDVGGGSSSVSTSGSQKPRVCVTPTEVEGCASAGNKRWELYTVFCGSDAKPDLPNPTVATSVSSQDRHTQSSALWHASRAR